MVDGNRDDYGEEELLELSRRIGPNERKTINLLKNLSEEDVQNVERVYGAIEKAEQAKAKHEHNKSWRILFERAPAETLPFIIYSVYVGCMALGVLFRLINLTGDQLLFGSVLLALCIIAPLLVLPMKKVRDVIGWFREWRRNRKSKKDKGKK